MARHDPAWFFIERDWQPPLCKDSKKKSNWVMHIHHDAYAK